MIIGERGQKIPADVIEAYKGVAPATIGHISGARVMTSAIKPGYSRCKVVGQAFTVRSVGLDITATSKACELIEAGEVMVVDRAGDVEHACIGEFRALDQQKKGVVGWIIDGASTDILACADIQFPIFARSWSALVGQALNSSTGYVNGTIVCGGVVVNPGDLIVADDDGVAVLTPGEAVEHLEHCLEVEARETRKRLEYQK